MEPLVALAVIAVVALLLVSPFLAVFAFVRLQRVDREVGDLRAELGALRARVDRWARPPAPTPPPVPAAVPVPVAPPPEVHLPPAIAPAPARVSAPRPPAGDFASNLGPKILAAAAGLAFVVTLGLFVKIAWDNNWVGPTGRVLFGAVFGLGLLVGGVRLLGRRYRPLGQALAGAGLAGLYTSAFAAHALLSPDPARGLGRR